MNSFQQGDWGLVLLGVLTSLLSAYYYLRIVKTMWFERIESREIFTYNSLFTLLTPQTSFYLYTTKSQHFHFSLYTTLFFLTAFLSRRFNFLSPQQMKWFRRYLGPVQKEKHFINTLHQVIFLHYYKSTSAFACHFGRELEKVHKKVHWRLIHSFKNLLLSVPVHPLVRRQYYGLLIEIKGRPRGRARTFIFRMREGSVAPQSYFFRISFGMGRAFAKVGVLGIKTWITY